MSDSEKKAEEVKVAAPPADKEDDEAADDQVQGKKIIGTCVVPVLRSKELLTVFYAPLQRVGFYSCFWRITSIFWPPERVLRFCLEL